MSRASITVTAVTFLLLTAPLVGVATASGGGLTAVIASPLAGDDFSRVAAVEFTDASTSSATGCPVDTWRWTFDDGSPASALQHPTHTFSALGSYLVALQVRSSQCTTLVSTTTVQIDVVNLAPLADLAVGASQSAGVPFVLDGSQSSDDTTIASYLFTVDGVELPPQTGATLTRTITAAGAHTASLVVVDADGASSAPAAVSFDVAAGPLATIDLDGPALMVVGSTHTFDPTGFDSYGNVVTLAEETFSFTARESLGDGTQEVCATEGAISGCLDVPLAVADLDRIDVVGDTTVVAGTTHYYTLTGYDEFDNEVALLQASKWHNVSTVAGIGADAVTYSEQGVQGSLTLDVIPETLASLTFVSPPATLVAGATHSFELQGFDQYGNERALVSPTVSRTAQTSVGPQTFTATESGITASTSVTIVADALDHITIAGPATIVAGATETYLVRGFDQHGNPVPAGPDVEFTAPTAVGFEDLCHTYEGFTACQDDIEVVADELFAIAIDGALSPAAGSTQTYTFTGEDQYGNPVPLSPSSTTLTIGTAAGASQICETQQDVSECLAITIVPAELTDLVITGPTTPTAGTTPDYVVRGFDAYGNEIDVPDLYAFPVGTVAGPATVPASYAGVSESLAIVVQPAALAVLTLTGPPSLTAGATATFDAAGVDAYGNTVTLDEEIVDLTARETPLGTQTFCHEVDGISDCTDVTIVAGDLASITLAAPASLVAGTTGSFDPAGSDVYGNPVALLQESFTASAGTLAGPKEFCYEEGLVSGCATVEILPAALATIAVSGAATLVAGTTGHVYDVLGYDTYQNTIALSPSTITVNARQTPTGAQQICHTVGAVTGCFPGDVTIVPAALAAIQISGDETVVAGTPTTYAFAGRDAYSNAVPLDPSSVAVTPTVAGPYTVSTVQQGVTGQLQVTVVAAALASIDILGPASVIAGSTQTYTLHGEDAYGNPVGLAQSSLSYTAPEDVGSYSVCYDEPGAFPSVCIPVEVTADTLATIHVTGPSPVLAGSTHEYALTGEDEFGNPITLAQSSLTVQFPHSLATQNVCYSETIEGTPVSGCLEVTKELGPLAQIVVSGPSSMTVGTSSVFTMAGYDAAGNAADINTFAMSYLAPTATGTVQVCHSEQGVTGCRTVQLTPDEVASIVVSGPGLIQAGESATFSIDGRDQHGNPGAASATSFVFDAPTTVGATQACYTENGVEGCQAVQVVANDLASIVLSGPASLVAGTTGTFDPAGADQHGNVVTLLQETFQATAQTTAGAQTFCYAEGSVEGCLVVEVLADGLATIVLDGPTSLVAGTSGAFDPAGFDTHGNTVALDVESFTATAQTTAGTQTFCHAQDNVQGCRAVQVLPAALASILVTGPTTLPAGESATFAVQGSDAYGNAVTLATASVERTAPSSAGAPFAACYTEQGVTGCQNVEVVPDALFEMSVNGPVSVVAGSTHTYAVSGADQYGNPVALQTTSLEQTFSTAVGTTSVCHGEQGVSDCLEVEIVADVLHSILVVGPSSVTAGIATDYAYLGFDQFGNPVGLAETGTSFLSTVAGPATLSYTQGAVTGALGIVVEPAALATIAVDGPTTVLPTSTAVYSLAGADAYGNAVPLAESSIERTFPSTTGVEPVWYTELGITGTLSVTVVHDALALITVDGPTSVVAGVPAEYALAGFDQFGNDVPLAQATKAFFSDDAGPATVSYEEQGVIGSLDVLVVAAALDHITIVGAPTLVAGTTGTYAVSGFDAFDNPVPLAVATVDHVATTAVGPRTVLYSEDGVHGSLAIEVIADALFTIDVIGPAEMVAGTQATFAFEGNDQYGNDVPLQESSRLVTAPEQVGTMMVCAASGAVSACDSVAVVPDVLADILITGPSQVVAGETNEYLLFGFDQHGNAVTLDASSLSFQETAAGPATVSYAEDGISETVDVLVVHAALASIAIDGPGILVAGTSATYALSGADAFGNAVPLAQDTLDFTAPTAYGPTLVQYTESGVDGELGVLVIADALHHIVVTGPASLVANATADYALAGFDQHENPVALLTDTLAFQAPTAAGPTTASYTEQGVTGAADVLVLHDALASIAVAGPTTVAAGTTETYALAGFDQFGNDVPLAQSTIDFSSTEAGPASVAYQELDVEGSLAINVVPAALAQLTLTGPSTVEVGKTATFQIAREDAYGNAIAATPASFQWVAPPTPQSVQVCRTEEDVTGCADVEVVPGAVHRVVVSAARSTINVDRPVALQAKAYDSLGNLLSGVTFTWSAPSGNVTPAGVWTPSAPGAVGVTASANGRTGTATINAVTTLLVEVAMDPAWLGDATGNVSVRYLDGGAVENATVDVTFGRMGLAAQLASAGHTEVSGTTDEAGRFAFAAPAQWTLPGQNEVRASAAKGLNEGEDAATYSI